MLQVALLLQLFNFIEMPLRRPPVQILLRKFGRAVTQTPTDRLGRVEGLMLTVRVGQSQRGGEEEVEKGVLQCHFEELLLKPGTDNQTY
jgi:hypothetical protein